MSVPGRAATPNFGEEKKRWCTQFVVRAKSTSATNERNITLCIKINNSSYFLKLFYHYLNHPFGM